MALSFFVTIDSNMKSRIVAQALIDWKIKDAYSWILQCMLNAIGIIPKIFVTDTDSGIDIAIQLKYPSAFHIHCIWHIGQNLPLRFRFKFGELFKPFKRDFYKCRNSLDQEIFKDR